MRTNSPASVCDAVACPPATALWTRVVVALCKPLPVSTSGTIAIGLAVLGAWFAFAVAPCWAIDLPPGRMLPEKAALQRILQRLVSSRC